jgi:hypothetical protein
VVLVAADGGEPLPGVKLQVHSLDDAVLGVIVAAAAASVGT